MKHKYDILPPMALFLAAAVTGMFFDLSISTAIYSKNNIFSLFMASIGELPMYGGFGFAGAVIFGYLNQKSNKTWSRLAGAALFLICAVFGLYLSGKAFVSVNAWGAISDTMRDNLLIGISVCLVLLLPFWLIGLKVGKESADGNPDAFRAAVAFGIIALLQIGLITLVKGVFHRPRFRFLENSDQMDLFKPVFTKFDGYASCITDAFTKEEFKSFPSGHTGSGAMMIVLMTYIPYFTKKKDFSKQNLFLWIGVFYTILLAFSRMLIGAHFLTDVSCGGLVTMAAFLLIDILLFNEKANRFFVKMVGKYGIIKKKISFGADDGEQPIADESSDS